MGTSPNGNRAMGAWVAKPRPNGWPVGSFETYAQAQAAVDMLSDAQFPVENLTIVGVDLMEVEKVVGRLTWGKLIMAGAASGAMLGLLFGAMLSVFSNPTSHMTPLLTGIVVGVIYGVIANVVPHAFSRGKRDFSSTTEIVAGRYDVLCDPATARQARDMIARHYPREETPESDR